MLKLAGQANVQATSSGSPALVTWKGQLTPVSFALDVLNRLSATALSPDATISFLIKVIGEM